MSFIFLISYEINGPWSKKEHGTKIDKYGRERPEIIKWVGQCSGEQTIQRADGTLTPVGRRLRTMMQAQRINNSNLWDVFVDRDFGQFNNEFNNFVRSIANSLLFSKAA
jgi:hypothetical protein